MSHKAHINGLKWPDRLNNKNNGTSYLIFEKTQIEILRLTILFIRKKNAKLINNMDNNQINQVKLVT